MGIIDLLDEEFRLGGPVGRDLDPGAIPRDAVECGESVAGGFVPGPRDLQSLPSARVIDDGRGRGRDELVEGPQDACRLYTIDASDE